MSSHPHHMSSQARTQSLPGPPRPGPDTTYPSMPSYIAGPSTVPVHAHTMPASSFQPQIRLSCQPRAFDAHSPQFNPQFPLPLPYFPAQPQPGPSTLYPRDSPQSQSSYFHFDRPAAHEQDDEDDDEDEDEDEDAQPGKKAKGKGRLGGPRAPGACDPCKQSKVKCVFPASGPPCRRCAQGGHDCRVSGRKQKPRPPSHAELLARLREKDRVIYSLLLPGQPFPDAAPAPDFAHAHAHESDHSPGTSDAGAGVGVLPTLPVWDKRTPKREVERRVDAWIAHAKTRLPRTAGEGTSEGVSGEPRDRDRDAGTDTPNPRRWSIPGDAPEVPAMPEILTRRLVTHQEVDKLFEVFFDKINMFFSICDPAIHTPARVLETSPFLYTTICAVASRHYPARPDLYPQLLDSAKRAAGAALNEAKSIETCQAYLLLGVYHPPARTFLEDRTFLYYGLAIRMATDLELHVPPPPPPPGAPRTEQCERALLNRTRVWLNCFCNDRSISTQLGKPSAIQLPAHKAIPFDLARWWRSSPYNGPHDIHMCAYASLLQVVSAFHEVVYSDEYSADGGKKKLDLRLVQSYADDVAAVRKTWTLLLADNYAANPSPLLMWRDNLWPFVVSYAKLVVLSIGLQHGLRQGLRQTNPFSDQCIDAATDVLKCITGKMAELGYLRYCVEAYFLFTGFAAAFLLKILRPKFSFMMTDSREQEIVTLVQRLIDLFGSNDVAIDDRHTPKLYARFLAGVLRRHLHAKTSRDPHTPPAKKQDAPPAAPAAGSSYAYPAAPFGLRPPAPAASTPPDQSWGYDLLQQGQGASPYMEVDGPLPGEQGDMMLASMAAITDPRFWEQGTMPGFSWMTSAQPWPMSSGDEVSPPPPPDDDHNRFAAYEHAGGYPIANQP